MTKKNTEHFETLAIRSGHDRSLEQEHSEPIFCTSSFVFDSAEQARQRFSNEIPGNVYSRFTNPTVRAFETRLAALEQGDACVATSSGMAAILSLCMSLLKQGDHIVCSRSVFGSTIVLLQNYVMKFGVDVTFVSSTDASQWQDAIQDNTRFLFVESPSNPLGEIFDIEKLTDVAHKKDCLLVVDNCFCTPALMRPLTLGADVVIHSATKYLDGQGRCLGGAIVGRQDVLNQVYPFLRTAGPSMSPFNAWVFLKGLETLKLRMDAHCANAQLLAEWLTQQNEVAHVYYAGLTDHPSHTLAKRQQDGFGGIVSFDIRGGRREAWSVIDHIKLLSITANLGDTKSTITHPATTTHGRLTPEEREQSGIGESLIRIAVGLEHIEDIQSDLRQAFDKI